MSTPACSRALSSSATLECIVVRHAGLILPRRGSRVSSVDAPQGSRTWRYPRPSLEEHLVAHPRNPTIALRSVFSKLHYHYSSPTNAVLQRA